MKTEPRLSLLGVAILFQFPNTAAQVQCGTVKSTVLCNVFVAALPQSIAEVERTFTRLNNNKNKLSDCLAVCTLEAIIKSSENFPGDFKVNQILMHLHGKVRKTYFEKFENSEVVAAITDETFSL